MTFTTPIFLIFYLIVFFVYWNLNRKNQNRLILTASLFFYGWWDWRFLFVLILSSGIDFYVALALEKTKRLKWRKVLLGTSLLTNLGMLAFFKYFYFGCELLHQVGSWIGADFSTPVVSIILPLGISFYTFQALSYTIDVYRKRISAVPDLVEYFSFITFFPHMTAGPIQQAKHFLVQFHKDRHFNRDQVVDGCEQMLWGFFKKMFIADYLAIYVNRVYSNPHAASPAELLTATYFFAFQIYCDFSGYTDIAIGCARTFDLHMTRNFRFPYFSTNIKDFWTRWHISLSTWFRDYLYIPLGGNRLGENRRLLNILIVFAVSGFWHGANWTFLIWGLLHGSFYIFSDLKERWIENPTSPGRFSKAVSIFLTFQCVSLAWIFFRASSVSQATDIIRKILSPSEWNNHWPGGLSFWFRITILLGIDWATREKMHPLEDISWPRPYRWAAYYSIVFAILVGSPLEFVPFIYFQF